MADILYPIPLDSTLQGLVSKTNEVATKIKTPQTDYNETDSTKITYMLNKPELWDSEDTDKPSITDISDEAKALFDNIATTEATTTASKAYTQGDYLILNGKFYRVTSAISSGGTITVGTNVSATTIAAELKAALS